MGTFREDQYTFSIISSLVHLRMRNVSDKSCRENQNTRFTFDKLLSKIVAAYETMWINTVQPGRPDNNRAHAI
jgi:hypothetical protein